MLSQVQYREERVIAYASKSLEGNGIVLPVMNYWRWCEPVNILNVISIFFYVICILGSEISPFFSMVTKHFPGCYGNGGNKPKPMRYF